MQYTLSFFSLILSIVSNHGTVVRSYVHKIGKDTAVCNNLGGRVGMLAWRD